MKNPRYPTVEAYEAEWRSRAVKFPGCGGLTAPVVGVCCEAHRGLAEAFRETYEQGLVDGSMMFQGILQEGAGYRR